MQAWACSTLSTMSEFREGHAVEIATSYFSGMVPKLPRRP